MRLGQRHRCPARVPKWMEPVDRVYVDRVYSTDPATPKKAFMLEVNEGEYQVPILFCPYCGQQLSEDTRP